MADVCDQADEQQQILLDAAIKRSSGSALSIEGDGSCKSCGNNVAPVNIAGKIIMPRWCCIECRDAWYKEYLKT